MNSNEQLETNAMRQDVGDDQVQEMLALASRLREEAGGELDDDAILAVSEATGAPADYVRLALRTVGTEKGSRKTPINKVRASFLALEPTTRRYVGAGLLGLAGGFSYTLGMALNDVSGFMAGIGVIAAGVGLWNAARARTETLAATSMGITGGAFVLSSMFLTFLVNLILVGRTMGGPPVPLLPAFIAGGAFLGFLAHGRVAAYRKARGLSDPNEDRQALLDQLLEIQARLKSDERMVTFLSVDIVGSTKLKEGVDPLLVEYTFREYHRFVEAVTTRHNGRVHSTAGDGVTCAFDRPEEGFQAARSMLSGLFEFNAARNRIGRSIELRAGLHTDRAMAPGQDVGQLNFASVIDLAAHLQKYCPEGAIAISDRTMGMLRGIELEERVDAGTVSGRVWRPRIRVKPEDVRTSAPPID